MCCEILCGEMSEFSTDLLPIICSAVAKFMLYCLVLNALQFSIAAVQLNRRILVTDLLSLQQAGITN